MQLRLGDKAWTTKDLDLSLLAPHEGLHQALVRAALLDPGDWFQFEVERPTAEIPADLIGGVRFQVQGLLDGRRFEIFHVDVGWGDVLIGPGETLTTPALLAFAGIPPTEVPCYPLTQQVAEKVHAYTRPRATGASSRAKDLVDILLIAGLGIMNGEILHTALRATFDVRETHALPLQLPDPPATWTVPYRRLAGETGLDYPTLADAGEAAQRFLAPVLRGEVVGMWDPIAWSWLPT